MLRFHIPVPLKLCQEGMSAVRGPLALIVAALLVISTGAQTNIVEVGSLATISAEAALYDSDLSVDNGCDPAGCVAALTRVSFA